MLRLFLVLVLLAPAGLILCCGGSPRSLRKPKPVDGPGFDAAEPAWTSAQKLTTLCKDAMDRASAHRKTMVAIAGGEGTGDALESFNELLLALDDAAGVAELMFSVHPDESVRKAAEACEQDLKKLYNEVKLDGGVFKALKLAGEGDLEGQARRFWEHSLRDFRRAGVDRDEATRTELKQIHEEMTRLAQDFDRNVREDVRTIVLDGPEALAGLPADFVDAHKPGEDGKVKVTTTYPDFYPIQTYAEDAELRRRLYNEFLLRGYPQNKEILERLLKLRWRYAKTLGYDSWAAYMAEDKMVRSAAAVDSFIGELKEACAPNSARDLEKILERKRKDLPQAQAVQMWDRFYYVGKVRAEEYDYDAQEARAYFSYPKVKAGIIELYSKLFGVEMVPLGAEPRWHEDVEAYELRSDGERIAVFYLDMHPRADKYQHAAMFPIHTGVEGGRVPRASLVCNFPDPEEGDGKALMEHSQVVTFFHEFGHLLHHLLSRGSPWVGLAGINVEWDFVEAPSQLLEEWAWDPQVLAGFATHAETGEPIPADLVKRMRAADELGKGVHVMRQIFYTAYSFYVHNQDPANLDLDAYEADTYREYSPYPALPGAHVYTSFGHIVGYSSMYYTYQWSLVIAKDLFTRFAEKGLLDPEVAKSYRDNILLPGGTEDAAVLVERFLGRPYSMEAYRAWLER